MTQGERAFGLTVVAFLLTAAFQLRFAIGLPVSPLLIFILVVPPAFVGLVWAALHRKCSRGGAWPGRIAWLLIAVFSFSCYFLVSFGGMAWLPACALLAHAAVITPRAT